MKKKQLKMNKDAFRGKDNDFLLVAVYGGHHVIASVSVCVGIEWCDVDVSPGNYFLKAFNNILRKWSLHEHQLIPF